MVAAPRRFVIGCRQRGWNRPSHGRMRRPAQSCRGLLPWRETGLQAEGYRSFERYARFAVLAGLVVGVYVVLAPFFAAMLFAVVVCASTWAVFVRLRLLLRGHSGWAALIMTLLLFVMIAGPVTLLAFSLTDAAIGLSNAVKGMLDRGPVDLPAWVVGLPVVGELIDEYWHRLAESREELVALARRMIDPAQNFAIAAAQIIGQGLLQLIFAVFVMFFFYRDGELLIAKLHSAADRLAAVMGREFLDVARGTLVSVAYGMIGTALAQGIVATVGFLIAGVPAAFLLGAGTFLVSMIPVGPPLIWGGAAAWLVYNGETGWAIFIIAYGLLVISSVDNVLKPILISRGSSLSFFTVMVGVIGGVLAFGFMGIFVGPTLLALAINLTDHWLGKPAAASDLSAP